MAAICRRGDYSNYPAMTRSLRRYARASAFRCRRGVVIGSAHVYQLQLVLFQTVVTGVEHTVRRPRVERTGYVTAAGDPVTMMSRFETNLARMRDRCYRVFGNKLFTVLTVISLWHSRLFGDNRPQTGLYPRCREGGG